MQLTGQAPTSGHPVTHAVLMAPPEGGIPPEGSGWIAPYIRSVALGVVVVGVR
jgi:hypothetical protein